VLNKSKKVVVYFPYVHDKFDDECFTKNSHSWDEVIQRKTEPTLTGFKNLSMDEQVEFINQTFEVVFSGVTIEREN
jgi:hypothetical protein